MTITETQQGNAKVVGVQGRLDAVTSPEFEKKLAAIVDDGCRQLVIDCSALDYISSAGLRVFLAIAKRLKNVQGTIVVAAAQTQVREIFDIAGFAAILPIKSTVADAVQG
ncbi:MAG: STAS domain-containing protein [Lentisphaeria bacterium]